MEKDREYLGRVLGGLIEALDKLEDSRDYESRRGFLPLLTPETAAKINEKYGNKNPFTEKDIQSKILSYIDNINVEITYAKWEKEILGRQLSEKDYGIIDLKNHIIKLKKNNKTLKHWNKMLNKKLKRQ
jgi:hypothetical protein